MVTLPKIPETLKQLLGTFFAYTGVNYGSKREALSFKKIKIKNSKREGILKSKRFW
jgi:uncharacterized protein YheU (UPF0270 family)